MASSPTCSVKNPGSVMASLRDLAPQLGAQMALVANLILSAPEAATEMTIHDMASESGTSSATITRLARRLGYPGFRDLRDAIVAAVAEESKQFESVLSGMDLALSDDMSDILSAVRDADIRTLHETRRSIDESAIRLVADRIAAARRIEIVGMGGSGVMADELHQRLHRLGLMSWAWTDVHQALTSVAHCGPGDVVICVSHTGRTREAIECLQRAAESGAYAVALTSHSSSPLAQAADVVLRTTSGQVAIRPDALAARHSQLYVIDVLLIVVMQRMRNDIEAILTKTANAVSDHQVDPHRRAHRGDQGPSGKSASR